MWWVIILVVIGFIVGIRLLYESFYKCDNEFDASAAAVLGATAFGFALLGLIGLLGGLSS